MLEAVGGWLFRVTGSDCDCSQCCLENTGESVGVQRILFLFSLIISLPAVGSPLSATHSLPSVGESLN